MEWMHKIYELRKQLHNIPEPSMKETKTKELLETFCRQEMTGQLIEREGWFAVYIPGESDAAPIAFRADFDAVMGGDGICRHACGHDGHSSMLAGLGVYLTQQGKKPARSVYLIFQPGEETGQGGKLCAPFLQEKGIREVYGCHNIPGYPLGTVLLREGTFACASAGLSVQMTGTPTHAAYPEAGNNPAGALAELVLQSQTIAARIGSAQEAGNSNEQEIVLATVIGADLGGNAYGMAAADGEVRFTLRAKRQEQFEHLMQEMKAQAQRLAEEGHFTLRIQEWERFPATENHTASVKRVQEAAKLLQMPVKRLAEPMRWSEDFGYYLMQTEGAFFGIGAGTEHPQLHTKDYQFPDELLEKGIRLFAQLI